MSNNSSPQHKKSDPKSLEINPACAEQQPVENKQHKSTQHCTKISSSSNFKSTTELNYNIFRHGWLSWGMAYRFYKAKASIKVLSFINVLTKLGIILGISILLMTSSVINGFNSTLHQKFLNLIPQAIVYTNNGQPFTQGQKLYQDLANFKNVKDRVPIVNTTVLLENGTYKQVTNLVSVNPSNYQQVSLLPSYIDKIGGFKLLLASSHDPQTKNLVTNKVQFLLKHSQTDKATTADSATTNQLNSNDLTNYTNNPSIILGYQLAKKLHLQVGDFVRVMVFGSDQNISINQYYIVSGIVNSNGLFDKTLALANIFDAKPLVGLVPKQDDSGDHSNSYYHNDKVTGNLYNYTNNELDQLADNQIANAFQIKLDNIDHDNIAPPSNWFYPQNLSYTSWGRVYSNIKYNIPMIQSLLNFGLAFVVALATFNVICSILIQIKDKKKSLTSLQAVGLSTKQIHLIFFFYSLILSGRSVIMGCLLGVLLSLGIESLSAYLSSHGIEILSASNYFIDYIPVTMRWQDFCEIALIIIGVSVVTAVMTSFLVNKPKVDLTLLT